MPINNIRPLIKRIAFLIGGIITIAFIALLIIPYAFKDQINTTIKRVANEHIDGELTYSDIQISFFKHFPALTTSITDVKLKGSAPFADSTLLDVKEISIGLDVSSLFKEKIVLEKFIVSDGTINILVDSTGAANYAIYNSSDTLENTSSEQDTAMQMAFKLLKFENIDLHYTDASLPMQVHAKGFNYEGRGDLMASVFDLETSAQIKSFSFIFDNESYVDQKSIDAELVTRINNKDMTFIFEKNDIQINKLPVRFKGELGFLANGYHLNFKLKSQESTLVQLLSLVPDGYADWLKDTRIKGTSEVFMNLEGDYIVEESQMPNLSLGLIIKDGYMAYKDAKVPISDWNTRIRIDIPQMNTDSLHVDLKQFDFKVAHGFFKSNGTVQGLDPMTVDASVQSSLDLGSLYQAIRWPDFSFAGQLDLSGKINGIYATDTLPYGIRNKKQVYIASVPTFHVTNTLKNGYFKLASLPAAIENIAYKLDAIGTDNQIKNAKITLRDIDIKSLNNIIKGHADIQDLQQLKLDANIQAALDLSDIKKVYPLDSVDIAGNVMVNIVSKGFMDLTNNIIPETKAAITMKNGYFKSWEYPIPLEQIQVETHIHSQTGSLQDLSVKILPISFKLAGEPFFLNADFENFNNIKYAIRSKGKLNLEPLYKMFAIEGTKVNGYVQTDLDLAGLQSDALQGRYNRLKNKGSMDIGDIQVETELLPLPIHIKSGKFSFHREKLNFNQFVAQYGNNEISIKGFVGNLINYLTMNTDVLKGKFDMRSKSINVNDFMAYNSDVLGSSASGSSSGVVLIPDNLDVEIKGFVNQVAYDNIYLKNFKSNMKIKSGQLILDNTGFELAGLKSDMNIRYRSLNTHKARFDFTVKADSFDIQRAYKEIPLFQEMITSAKNAHGIVSLDYQLAGLLDEEMSPIMRSITGKGSLTLEQIKFLNFKLLNGISKETGKEGFLKSDVNKVRINTSIANNVMTIERTKMKMAGFRPRFEGQVTLDGRMNLGFRLGLPPWGIFGIPMQITGTADKYKIKLGKYKEDDLDEDMDEEDKALFEASLASDSTQTVQ